MSSTEMYSAGASVRVLHVIATTDDPVTPREIAGYLGTPPKSTGTVAIRLWRSGLVTRTQRTGQRGQPYEYTLCEEPAGGVTS